MRVKSDERGFMPRVGDVLVRGERRGSGCGELVYMTVVALEPDLVVSSYRDGSRPRKYLSSADYLILPPHYASLLKEPES